MVLGDEQDRAAAVGADAAVQFGERIGDHRAVEDLVDGDRIAVHGVRVGRRVGARLDGHLGQLLQSRAVLVHMAAGGHGVFGDQGVPVGGLELERAAGAEGEVGGTAPGLEVGAGGGTVDEEYGVGVAGGDRVDGVRGQYLPGGAADRGRIDPGGAEPQIFGDLDGREGAEAGRCEAVDHRAVQTRVGERPAGGLGVQGVGGGAVHAPTVGQGDSGDGDLAIPGDLAISGGDAAP